MRSGVDDREPRFAVGDKLYLREWDPATDQELPRWIGARVTCVVRGPIAGLADGYCVLGLTDYLCCYGSWSKSDTAGRLRERSFTRTKGVA